MTLGSASREVLKPDCHVSPATSVSSCVRQRIHIDLLLMTLMMLVSRTVAQEQGQSPPQGLLASAEAVVAVEIVSADYRLTVNDGPMVAAANVLKVLKGPFTPGRDVRFFETWWAGPTYQKGEYRILFLQKAAPAEIPWRIASHPDARRTDFFIERDAVSDLSLQSLDVFLSRIATSKDNRRKKAVFAKGQ
jgi:hypothetical protein